MGIKERRTKILLSIHLLSTDDKNSLILDERVQRIFDFSFNQKTRGTLSGLLREGYIEKKTSEKTNENIDELTKEYTLTQKGFEKLCLDFPFFRFMRSGWDGRWRILSYEIPEKKRELRDRLRREVATWGLGPWHRSFWITPHPVVGELRELLHSTQEEQYIQVFESDHTLGSMDTLIEKVWSKSLLEKRYKELFRNWHKILSEEGEQIEKFTKIVGAYVGVLRIDPGLPSELMGKSWIGFEAFTIFSEVKGLLFR